MRLSHSPALLSLLLLTACGPQAPDANQWNALAAAAEASATAQAIGTRCTFETTAMTAAYDKVLARYVLSEQQKAELAQIGKNAAEQLAGEPLPAEHALCTDGVAMRDRVMGLLAKM